MPYIKIFIKEELKFNKQENDLVNSNTEIIKSLEKKLGNGKENSNGSNLDLDTDLSTLNSKLVDETINSCSSNILDSSVSKTINCGSNLSTPQISEEYC